MDQLRLIAWMLLNVLIASLALLTNHRVRSLLVRVVGPRLRGALRRLNLVADPDDGPGELWTALYRERLVGHVARVRRFVATDEAMSATRQIGNRIALARLLRDLDELPAGDLLPDLLIDRPIQTWNPVERPAPGPARDRSWLPAPRYSPEPMVFGSRTDDAFAPAETRGRSRVEVLEIGWGH